jgi:hypothetical protein
MNFVKLNQDGFVIERGFGPTIPEGFVKDNGLYKDALNEIPKWVLIIDIKNTRNLLLYESDWTQIPNNPLTVEQQQAWADYRQQLRDIKSQPGYPNNVIWPTPPQG